MRPIRVTVPAFLVAVVGALIAAFAPTGSVTEARSCAGLLWIGCDVAMLSVGMFFVPAAMLMTIAATQRQPTAIPRPPVPMS